MALRVGRIHDISQPVGTDTAVWPGDRRVEMAWTMRRADGDSVNVAALCMSAHTGTHLDGPLHFEDDGAVPAEVPLEQLIGPALVIDARGHAVLDVALVEDVDLADAERLLFRCFERVDPTCFPPDFPAISPALARRLADAGVKLAGTEAPSVDAADSKTLETHRILAAGGVAILENVVLSDVAPGHYTLVALPLRLTEADSSPVRAVLLEAASQE